MEFTAEHKKHIERMIVDQTLNALKNKNLLYEELPDIGDFVLGNINSIRTRKELMEFLSDLSLRWPIFLSIKKTEMGKNDQIANEEKVSNASMLAKSGMIDEALRTIREKN